MKSISLFTALFLVVLSISSCKLEPGGGILNPKDIEPIVLEDRYDEDILLTDHNDEGVDYIVTDRIDIYDGTMTIEPGVTLEFEGGAFLNVGLNGKLDAVGTSSAPIRMIAEEQEPSWAGIFINSDKSNKIHHCIIDNAGSGKEHGLYNTSPSAIAVEGKASIENTIITNSGAVGIVLYGRTSEITSFDGNSIKDGASFPILADINLLRDLNLSDNIYADNGKNMIGVVDNFSNRLVVPTSLEGLDIPYFFDGKFEIYENFTLNRGVEMVMADNSVLLHDAGAHYRFKIEGTENNHVVIRGEESENGFWQGLYISSKNSGNTFEYLDISDGGGQELTFRDGKANISLELGGILTLNNCTSARSGNCEVYISDFGDAPVFTNNSPAITSVCME